MAETLFPPWIKIVARVFASRTVSIRNVRIRLHCAGSFTSYVRGSERHLTETALGQDVWTHLEGRKTGIREWSCIGVVDGCVDPFES